MTVRVDPERLGVEAMERLTAGADDVHGVLAIRGQCLCVVHVHAADVGQRRATWHPLGPARMHPHAREGDVVVRVADGYRPRNLARGTLPRAGAIVHSVTWAVPRPRAGLREWLATGRGHWGHRYAA